MVRSYPRLSVTIVVALLGVGTLAAGQPELARWAVGLWAGGVALAEAVDMLRQLRRGHFGLDMLAVVAIAATLATGDAWAALVVTLMLTGGEALERFAERRAKHELSALLNRAPQFAHRLDAAGSQHRVPVALPSATGCSFTRVKWFRSMRNCSTPKRFWTNRH